MSERIRPEVSKCRIAGYFAVLLFAVLFAIMLNASSAKADAGDIDSGEYKGVPWRLTSNVELIFGETGEKYDLGRIRIAKDIYRGSRVKKVSFLGTVSINDAKHMFKSCSSLTSINLSGLNTSNVISMGSMFFGCKSLKFKKYFKVKKNGNITVKKKLKKGMYKLKIKVTAAGNVQYKKVTKTATVRIKVK